MSGPAGDPRSGGTAAGVLFAGGASTSAERPRVMGRVLPVAIGPVAIGPVVIPPVGATDTLVRFVCISLHPKAQIGVRPEPN